MDPQIHTHTQLIEHRCLEYQHTKLGRLTSFGQWITPQNCQWWTINWHMTYQKSMCSIRVHLKLLKFTAQVYSSSVPVRLSIGASMCLVRGHVKVLKFTVQGYSSSLLVSFTPHWKH